jgi:hypothetical protein
MKILSQGMRHIHADTGGLATCIQHFEWRKLHLHPDHQFVLSGSSRAREEKRQ